MNGEVGLRGRKTWENDVLIPVGDSGMKEGKLQFESSRDDSVYRCDAK